MEKIIRKMVYRLFPELTAKLHLPRWGKVVGLPELPIEDGERLSDPFYPRYAVNVQLLDEHGNATDSSILQAVPLPVSGVGARAGKLDPPAIDSIVEIAFAYGRPDKPFIRTVLPFGWELPAIKEGESRTQTQEGVYQYIDDKGNFENKTHESLNDIIGKLAHLECETRTIIASKEQDHRSPKTWLGSDSENVLKLLSELMATVSTLASTCATHTHGGVTGGTETTAAPMQSADFTSKGSEATAQKARLDPITK